MTDSAKLHSDLSRIWGNPRGLRSLSAVNHTSVGLRFMVTGTVFFLIGGVLAMLIRTQLALPDQRLIGPELYNQLFTMHGTLMMFLFAIPVLEGLAMYLIPKMIGTRDLAFPRLGAFGYFCYLFGGIILCSSLLWRMAPSSGWFMYTPLSDATFSPDRGPDFWLLGITFVEISALSAGVELVVTILRMRAPGMTLQKMPIFCWYILAMALMILFGFPPLILASIMLELERAAGFIFFDSLRGGDPLLWQHLFWLFGHPEVYILFLPAAGIVSTIIPVFAGRPLVGYAWIVLAIITMGFISFGLWVHHMFTVGIPHLAQAFFSIASMLVAIPTGIQIFVWMATLWSGRVTFSLPMLWIFGFLVIFVCGGLTGVMLALVPFDWQVHDTHFVVAHMHYVLVGGMLFPLIAGFYYWLPHFSGRMPSRTLGSWGFWLTFIGFNATFLLMHLTGLFGMPRRVYTYEAGLGWDWLNLLSTVGGFVMAVGIAVIILDFLLHFRFGIAAPANPWKADTLEWATTTPPAPYNFLALPEVSSRHPLWDQPELATAIAEGRGLLARASGDNREVLGTGAVQTEVRELIRLPGNSWIPLQLAAVLAVVCICLLLRAYPVALAATLLSLVMLFRWSWLSGSHPVNRITPLERVESITNTWGGIGLCSVVVTLMADAALYMSLLFGWFYLWTVAPLWQFSPDSPLTLPYMLLCGTPLTLAALGHWLLTQKVRRGHAGETSLANRLWFISGLALLHWLLLAWVLIGGNLSPRTLAHDSVLLVTVCYLLLHSGIATVATTLQALRARRRYVSASQPYELAILRVFWLYTLVIYWIAFAAFALAPLMGGQG
jgi:cytochrome c oxidase subunit I+III